MNGKPIAAILATILPLVLLSIATQTKVEPFRLIWSEEATIAEIHGALKSKKLTCRQLVQSYIDRIEAHDKKGQQARKRPNCRNNMPAGRCGTGYALAAFFGSGAATWHALF